MHDGCPSHRKRNVVDFIEHTFGANWIGYKRINGAHRKWPPRYMGNFLLFYF